MCNLRRDTDPASVALGNSPTAFRWCSLTFINALLDVTAIDVNVCRQRVTSSEPSQLSDWIPPLAEKLPLSSHAEDSGLRNYQHSYSVLDSSSKSRNTPMS